MSTPPNSHKQSLLTQEIDAWVLAAQELCAKLHIQAAGPWNSNERYEAFAHMSELLLDAFEEMRIISVTLREDSQAIRGQADGLCEHSQKLLDRHGRAAEPSSRLTSPSPGEVWQAESRLLDIFKGELHRDQ
jgi:hypothetical protein